MNTRHISIRSKIVAIIVVTTALALAAGFALMLVTGVSDARQDLLDNHRAVARVTGAQCVTDLAFGDAQEAEGTLSKLGAVPDVEAAFLFDEDGALFSAYTREGLKEEIRPPGPEVREIASGDHIVVHEPIVYQNESYGSITLIISTKRLRDKLHQSLLTIGVLLIFLLAGTALLAWRLEAIVSEPILELADTAREISEHHDYSIRAQKQNDDEIGVLAESLNDMLEQIEHRQREREAADQRSREKSQFLANMSHELRTPLNAIIGFSEILRTRLAGTADDKERKFIDNINSSGQHLLGIVNDILDLSKIEAGRMEIHPERFPVAKAIESVCNLMRGVTSRSRVIFEIRIDDDVPEITADLVKVKQVLYNLLSNAVKFSPESSAVTIHVSTLDRATSGIGSDAVRFDVIDRGIGIDSTHHDEIFKEFQQVDGTTSRRFEGTGLGLALVKKFVEMHRGRIEVRSALGEGSTFSIVLPITFHGSAAEETPADRDRFAPASHVALVIEDERPSFEAIRRALDGSEFRPISAETGEQGLDLAESLRPSVIILDLVLPGIGGFDVLRELKSRESLRDIPVIVVSVLEDDRELGFVLGINDYLTKPVDPNALLGSMRRHLPDNTEGRQRHVLIIDDDPAFHEIVKSQLAGESIVFSSATNGPRGLLLAMDEDPSLIILDLLMGDMDGFEVAVRLRDEPRTAHIPILVATALDLTASDRARLSGKINTLVEKHDLNPERMQSVVRSLLSRPGEEATSRTGGDLETSNG